MINRLTGWDARLRDFSLNCLRSFDASRLEALDGGQRVYLDGSLQPLPLAPHLSGRSTPAGSLDTDDAEAMFRLRNRTFDDRCAYSYDCGRPDGEGGYERDDDCLYNRDTVGVYIVPDVATEPFSLREEWERVRQILAAFLPIQVRPVFVLQPQVVVEEAYDATRMVTEASSAVGILEQSEHWGEGLDAVTDRIPQWRRFITNDLAHLTVDTALMDTSSRSWHLGLE